jgi:hypothetical protein
VQLLSAGVERAVAGFDWLGAPATFGQMISLVIASRTKTAVVHR